MAGLPPVKRLVQEDFASQKSWIGLLLGPLNDFMTAVYNGLNRGLTFGENMKAQVKTLTVDNTQPTFTPIEFTSTIGRPAALWVVKIEDRAGAPQVVRAPVTVDWSYSNGLVYINNVSGLTSHTRGDTNTSTSLTNVEGAENVSVGQTVSGTGIPTSTTVTAVSGTTVTISQAATGSATVLLTFSGKTFNLTIIAVAG
jgi:hypothetical protein